MSEQPIILTANNPTHAVIWLHGLGADGNDFTPLIPQMGLEALPIKWIFPHAPTRPITLNDGMPMRGWYDIVTLERENFQDDQQGIKNSAGLVEQLIQEQITAGIAADKIILAGFSQGGAIALYTALTSRYNITKVLALSTYLPLAETISAIQCSRPQILMMHGINDDLIPISAAKASHDKLQELGCSLQWRQYPMGHGLHPEQLQDIASWFNANI